MSVNLSKLSVGDRVVVTDAGGDFAGLRGEIVARWWTLDMFDVSLDEGDSLSVFTFTPAMLRKVY